MSNSESHENPELGKSVDVNGYSVNYIDEGNGEPVILLHGSGPGVTGFANWRMLIPALSDKFRVIAPDVVGFGYTEHPDGFQYTLDGWVEFVIGLMDSLQIKKANFVGNSFGGALCLALAARHPERVYKIVMMGAAGMHFKLTDGLRKVWGYQPSIEAMRELMNVFTCEGFEVNDVIVESRYKASIRPGYQEAYQQLFPEPMQEKLDALCMPEDEITAIQAPALVVHGREDVIVPMSCSLRAFELLKNGQLHVFSNCGHWTMFEKADEFNLLVKSFLSDPVT